MKKFVEIFLAVFYLIEIGMIQSVAGKCNNKLLYFLVIAKNIFFVLVTNSKKFSFISKSITLLFMLHNIAEL